MKGKYLKRIGGIILAALMLSGTVFLSPNTVEAQGRRRVVIVRSYPRGFYRRFDAFGYDRWGYDGWGRDRWGNYDPMSPNGNYYRQYVFDNSDKAVSEGYSQGFKTGKDDGKKAKSFNPQRSHFYHDAGFGNFAEVYRSGFSRGYQEGYRAGENSRAS